MQHDATTLPSLDRLRRDARRLKQETRHTHAAALDTIARRHGFANWSLLARAAGRKQESFPFGAATAPGSKGLPGGPAAIEFDEDAWNGRPAAALHPYQQAAILAILEQAAQSKPVDMHITVGTTRHGLTWNPVPDLKSSPWGFVSTVKTNAPRRLSCPWCDVPAVKSVPVKPVIPSRLLVVEDPPDSWRPPHSKTSAVALGEIPVITSWVPAAPKDVPYARPAAGNPGGFHILSGPAGSGMSTSLALYLSEANLRKR